MKKCEVCKVQDSRYRVTLHAIGDWTEILNVCRLCLYGIRMDSAGIMREVKKRADAARA